MKVVLFCGGMGMRMRDYDERIPKPMVRVGYRPILWHVMKYYASFGHKDFILCLGYKADVIKNYFLNYDECASNDFVLSEGGRNLELFNSDIDDWRITFVDTGLRSNIGERLRAVQPFVAGEDVFLANYADGVTDLPLPEMIDHFHRHDRIASFVNIRPSQSFHVVSTGDDGTVTGISAATESGLRMNGGYFVFKQQIFDYMREGEELVEAPFHRLIREKQLLAYNYDGFWACMDTFKEKQMLDDLYMQEMAPWEVWKTAAPRTNGTRLATA